VSKERGTFQEKRIRDRGLDLLVLKYGGVGLAVDDNAAIIFEDDIYRVVASKKGSAIKRVRRIKGKIDKKIIEDGGTVNSLGR
jgi:hypothetical protein